MNGDSGCIETYHCDAEISDHVNTAVVTNTKCPVTLTLPDVTSHYCYETYTDCDAAISCNGIVVTVVNNSCNNVTVIPNCDAEFGLETHEVCVDEGRQVRFYNKGDTWFVGY